MISISIDSVSHRCAEHAPCLAFKGGPVSQGALFNSNINATSRVSARLRTSLTLPVLLLYTLYNVGKRSFTLLII